MKKLIFLFCFIGVLFSCSDDDNNNGGDDQVPSDLKGVWMLTDIKGDSGKDFQKVESNKTVIFKNDSVIVSNGSLCENSITSNESSSARYRAIEDDRFMGALYQESCDEDDGFPMPRLSIVFDIKDSYLYIYYSQVEDYNVARFKKK